MLTLVLDRVPHVDTDVDSTCGDSLCAFMSVKSVHRRDAKLQRIVRRDRNRIKVRRTQVILASAQGSRVPAIARRLYFSPQHIRSIIKDFNSSGFAALAPKYCGRRPK